MTELVVDTNVPIVANARDTHTDEACQLACVAALKTVVADQIVAVDEGGRILEEYRRHLRHAGVPGVGDMFFKHLVNHQWQPTRVRRVPISPIDAEERGFDELPPNAFDPSDRKFLAVAVASEATVLNATDSDWYEQTELMQQLGVEVRQLCPQYATKQAKR